MIQVLLHIGHSILRDGIKQLLRLEKDFKVLEGKATLEDMEKTLTRDTADVALVDSLTLEKFWLSFVKEALPKATTPPIIIIGISGKDQLSHHLLKSRIAGYMQHESSPAELCAAIRTASEGRQYISKEQSERLAGMITFRGKVRNPTISPREYQVMNMLIEGKTPTEIARELQLSVKTIATFRYRLLQKLNLKNEMELARFLS
jgi:two-component system, NarL family, invasion response regulator UvrY